MDFKIFKIGDLIKIYMSPARDHSWKSMGNAVFFSEDCSFVENIALHPCKAIVIRGGMLYIAPWKDFILSPSKSLFNSLSFPHILAK